MIQEVRKHPDWNHILSVAVNQSFQHAPHPNWKASFVTDGPRNTPGDAIQFAEELGVNTISPDGATHPTARNKSFQLPYSDVARG